MRTHLKMIGGGEVAFDAILSFQSDKKRTVVSYEEDGKIALGNSRDSLKSLLAEYGEVLLRVDRRAVVVVDNIVQIRKTQSDKLAIQVELNEVFRHHGISRRERPNVKKVVTELLRARNVSSSDT